MLYIVSTPIGNLEDITFRALNILKNVVDLIACEDTRVSLNLLNHYSIKKPLISYNSHSSETKLKKIISELRKGKKVAFISDAGTPGFSDPGYCLIKEAIKEDIDVVPIPGVTAFATAITGSGLFMNRFLYLGFMPIKKGRKSLFLKLVEIKRQKFFETIVIYESVYRIIKTIKEIGDYFGKDHYIVIGRELTKKFEEFIRGDTDYVLKYFQDNKSKIKGEFVLIF